MRTLLLVVFVFACGMFAAAAFDVLGGYHNAVQASSKPFETYEMGDNCVYVLRDASKIGQAIAAVPRASAPNYYGKCQ